MIKRIQDIIGQSVDLKVKLLEDRQMTDVVAAVAVACIKSLKKGGKILFCGNGGSAADAQHLAAELSGRFYYDRPPLYAEALHVNTSYLTAVANDYSYDEVFARLLLAKGKKGDVVIGLSTSGNSPNIIRAFETARQSGITTVGLTGEGGGKMAGLCDLLMAIPSKDTPRIQECHIMLGHIVCELIESKLFPRK